MTYARSRGFLALFIALAILAEHRSRVPDRLARPPELDRPRLHGFGDVRRSAARRRKLLLTLIIAAVLAGSRMLMTAVDPRHDVYAFLALAFTYPQAFMAGYYNYSLSIGLFLIILAVWWRRRDGPDAATITLIAALLVLCAPLFALSMFWLPAEPGYARALHAAHGDLHLSDAAGMVHTAAHPTMARRARLRDVRDCDRQRDHSLRAIPFLRTQENANLDTDFKGFASRADTVDIEMAVPQDARIWAFATALNEQGRTRVHLPAR